MSHVSKGGLFITDLDALEKVCNDLGLELQRGKTEWCWWGSDAGDSDLAQGYDRSQFGVGHHAIKIKGTNPRMGPVGPWEIGLVTRADGKPGFEALWDGYGMHGQALERVAGKNLSILKREYSTELLRRMAVRQGFKPRVTVNAKGQRQVVCEGH
jgi:hypothetical protein